MYEETNSESAARVCDAAEPAARRRSGSRGRCQRHTVRYARRTGQVPEAVYLHGRREGRGRSAGREDSRRRRVYHRPCARRLLG